MLIVVIITHSESPCILTISTDRYSGAWLNLLQVLQNGRSLMKGSKNQSQLIDMNLEADLSCVVFEF